MKSLNNVILKKNLENKSNQQFCDRDYQHPWKSYPEFFNDYFDYLWSLAVNLNQFKTEAAYFPTLTNQASKCIEKLEQFTPTLLTNVQKFHTFKRPHTISLIKWRKTLRDYFRQFFLNHPNLATKKLVLFREYHACVLACHWYELYYHKWYKKKKK